MQHLTLIYVIVVVVLIVIGLWHVGAKVIGHILLGLMAGILAIVPFASKLSKPGVLLAGKPTLTGKATTTTAALPAPFHVTVTQTAATAAHAITTTGTIVSVPVISPVAGITLLGVLVLLSLIYKAKAKGKQQGPELPPDLPPPGYGGPR
jgi:hypothetical protein